MTTVSERATAGIQKPKAATQKVQCPCCEHTFDALKAVKPRSVEQNKRFWALMKAAWMHWPESHDEQFACINDLRLWLTMKAGWRDEIARIPIVGMKQDQAIMLVKSAFKAAESHAYPVAYKGSIVVFKAKSIAFAKMRHLDFCALNDAIADVIKAEMHITADELLDNTRDAA